MSKYEALDGIILSAIQGEVNVFQALATNDIIRAEIRLIDAHYTSGEPVEPWRVVDRRLQALRRAGKIRYNGKCWERADGAV